jgi:hypothetical protein
MDAETVHRVAQALSPKELQRFYELIQNETGTLKVVQKEIKKVKVVQRKTRTPIMTDAESMQAILRILKKAKETRFKHLYIAC